MNCFTFEKYTKVSLQSHDHITVKFEDGTLLARTVESTRSVGTRWNAIGTYGESPVYGPWLSLTESSQATDMFATEMERRGYTVRTKFNAVKGAVIVLRSNGIVTNPESIQGRIRDRSKHGKRGARFGMRNKTDVATMRHAVIEAQTKRCIAANLNEYGDWNGNCNCKSGH